MATTPHGPDRYPSAAHAASRLDVGVISAGRVGATLGAALSRAGHRVVAAAAISDASRDRARRLLPSAEILQVHEVAARATLLLLAVPDDDLAGVVSGLAEGGHLQPGQLLAHTSGSHGVEVLRPAVEMGALTLALHPVMTFTGRDEDLDRLSGVSFGVTADEALRPVAETLTVEMGGEPEFVPEESRALYHAGLSHGANHLTTLLNEAADVLRSSGVAHPERMLGPLLSATLDNTLRLGDNALTGPIARGDVGTVAAHLQALQAAKPEATDAYRALARRTADRAIAGGRLKTAAAEPLLGVLSGREDES